MQFAMTNGCGFAAMTRLIADIRKPEWPDYEAAGWNW
jgi:hypothetical protein